MPELYAPQAMTPDDALARLRDGNSRFVRGEGTAVGKWRPGLVDGQWPFATILGCSDSRAPAEYVFDQDLGDLFVIRVAGNIVAPSLVGSIEFAASQFGTRLVVVMGHTHCGAVKATVASLTDAGSPVSRNVKSIVDFITPHLAALPSKDVDPETLMRTAVQTNAVASAREIPNSSDLLRRLIDEGRVKIVAAVFDLATGVVSFIDP